MNKKRHKEPFRRFLGKVDYKGMTNFDHKHLGAYLKGNEYFTYGFDPIQLEKGIKTPMYFKVQQEYLK